MTNSEPQNSEHIESDRVLYERLLLDKELEIDIDAVCDGNVLADSCCIKPSRWIEMSTGIQAATQQEQSHIRGCFVCQKNMSKWEVVFECQQSSSIDSKKETNDSNRVEWRSDSNRRNSFGVSHLLVASVASALLSGALIYGLMLGNTDNLAQISTENEQLKDTANQFDTFKSKIAASLSRTTSELADFFSAESQYLVGDLSVKIVRQTLVNQGSERSPTQQSDFNIESFEQRMQSFNEVAKLLDSSNSIDPLAKAKATNLNGVWEATRGSHIGGEQAVNHYKIAANRFREAGEMGLAKAWLNLYFLSIKSQEGDEISRQGLLDRYLKTETDESIRTFVREALR